MGTAISTLDISNLDNLTTIYAGGIGDDPYYGFLLEREDTPYGHTLGSIQEALTEVIFSKDTMLEDVQIGNPNLLINIVNNSKLKFAKGTFTALSIENSLKLETFNGYIEGNETYLDLSNLSSLRSLFLESNSISKIKIPSNLTRLSVNPAIEIENQGDIKNNHRDIL